MGPEDSPTTTPVDAGDERISLIAVTQYARRLAVSAEFPQPTAL
jgi:hypothetical protein